MVKLLLKNKANVKVLDKQVMNRSCVSLSLSLFFFLLDVNFFFFFVYFVVVLNTG